MEFREQIIPIVTDVMELLQRELRSELEAQGHKLTGRLSDSIVFDISSDEKEIKGTMYAEQYAGALEFGVKAEKIPYSGRSGKGGTSLYIQGLINFFELRGLSGREAIGAAFATAAVHKREGMPTRSSSKYSSNGARTGFIRTTIERNMDKIKTIIEDRYTAKLELIFGETFEYSNIKFVR